MLGLLEEPFLKTGVMQACFHILGNSPVCSDILKITDKGKETNDAVALKNSAGIPSGPGLAFGLKCLIYFMTIAGVKNTGGIIELVEFN